MAGAGIHPYHQQWPPQAPPPPPPAAVTAPPPPILVENPNRSVNDEVSVVYSIFTQFDRNKGSEGSQLNEIPKSVFELAQFSDQSSNQQCFWKYCIGFWRKSRNELENWENILVYYYQLFLLGSDDFYYGPSWGCKREGASESFEMATRVRGFPSELQRGKAYGFCSLCYRSAGHCCKRHPSGWGSFYFLILD